MCGYFVFWSCKPVTKLCQDTLFKGGKRTEAGIFIPAIGGAVLVVEALLSEDGSGPLTAQLYSLNMLVQTEGRERTDVQYAALLTAAGFTNIRHCLTGKIYDAVLGHKKA